MCTIMIEIFIRSHSDCKKCEIFFWKMFFWELIIFTICTICLQEIVQIHAVFWKTHIEGQYFQPNGPWATLYLSTGTNLQKVYFSSSFRWLCVWLVWGWVFALWYPYRQAHHPGLLLQGSLLSTPTWIGLHRNTRQLNSS